MRPSPVLSPLSRRTLTSSSILLSISGMHNITDRAVVVKGQVVVRPIMTVALTYDHRLLDGREAVQFLVKIKQFVEDPRKMLL